MNINDNKYDAEEGKKLVTTLRKSLDDAGFVLLIQRDCNLCKALNTRYLLWLSIQPELKALDPSLGREFYPELKLL
eukprot:12042254-Ditylum_brightwellii.AAC.1